MGLSSWPSPTLSWCKCTTSASQPLHAASITLDQIAPPHYTCSLSPHFSLSRSAPSLCSLALRPLAHRSTPLIRRGYALLIRFARSYLAEKHGNWALYPRDPETRGRIHQYFNWHPTNTRSISQALFAPAMRPDMTFTADEIKKGRGTATRSLETIEAWLAASKWIAGSVPTVADLR